MKTYSRGRTSQEFKFAAVDMGLTVDDEVYQQGGDFIRFSGEVEGVTIYAVFSSVNSRVIGTANNKPFSTDELKDGEPWFDAILDLANTDD